MDVCHTSIRFHRFLAAVGPIALLLSVLQVEGAPDPASDRRSFVSRPAVLYDDLMMMEKMEGEGRAVITVEDGRIADVRMSKSTGHPYLDARAIAWIRARWQPSSGMSGKFTLPVVFKLPKSSSVTQSYRRLDPMFDIGKARGAERQGKVAVTASNGKITKIRLLTSMGNRVLDQKAIDWIRTHWIAPRGYTGTTELPFSLRFEE